MSLVRCSHYRIRRYNGGSIVLSKFYVDHILFLSFLKIDDLIISQTTETCLMESTTTLILSLFFVFLEGQDWTGESIRVFLSGPTLLRV